MPTLLVQPQRPPYQYDLYDRFFSATGAYRPYPDDDHRCEHATSPRVHTGDKFGPRCPFRWRVVTACGLRACRMHALSHTRASAKGRTLVCTPQQAAPSDTTQERT